MKWNDAIKLQNEDEVIVKKTGQVMSVVETEIIYAKDASNGINAMSVMLEDGNWYGYKEIK